MGKCSQQIFEVMVIGICYVCIHDCKTSGMTEVGQRVMIVQLAQVLGVMAIPANVVAWW